MRFLLITFLLCLTSCADQRSHLNAAPQSFDRPWPHDAAQPQMPAPDSSKVDQLRNDLTASNNQTQQTFAGVGLQMGKFTEKLQGFGGDLAHVDTKVTGVEKAVANLDVKIDQKFETNATVQAKAFSDFEARMDLKLAAQGAVHTAGVAALKSELDQTTQNYSSGRDTNISFTREMQKVLERSYQAQVELAQETTEVVKSFLSLFSSIAGILVILGRARNRADMAKSHDDHKEVMALVSVLARKMEIKS